METAAVDQLTRYTENIIKSTLRHGYNCIRRRLDFDTTCIRRRDKSTPIGLPVCRLLLLRYCLNEYVSVIAASRLHHCALKDL